MPVTEQERQLVADRLRAMLEKLPEAERALPFMRVLVKGEQVSLSAAQMLLEVLQGTEIGEEIVEMEMSKLGYYEQLKG